MSTRSSLVKFLVFVAATLLATGTLAATIANIQFGDKATYHAVFDDVTGLATGQEVRIAGVRVGDVTSIRVAPDKVHALVELKVLRTSVLTAGTKATIKYRNLVGERYVALTQDVGGATPLKDGATIGLDHTQSALDLTVLFNGFKPLFAALSPQDVNELSGNIISVLQGEGGDINSLLSKTASLTSTLADRDAVIGRTISNLNAVLGTVDAHDAALRQLIDQLQRFISGLAADRTTIGASLSNINSLTAQTADLLKVTRPSIKADIKHLRALTTNLNEPGNTATFEKFLSNSPGKIATITRTATYGSWFNFYMCDFSGTVKLPVGPAISLAKPDTLRAARCS
jgi:phospholipid/cholesterol/gamma-HCH transport system substrate-binding protein